MHTYIKRLLVLRALILHVHIMFPLWKETSFYAHNISTLLYKYTFIHTLLLFLFLLLVHICALEPNDISRNFVTAMLSVNTCTLYAKVRREVGDLFHKCCHAVLAATS